jgi:hypothetical protein
LEAKESGGTILKDPHLRIKETTEIKIFTSINRCSTLPPVEIEGNAW